MDAIYVKVIIDAELLYRTTPNCDAACVRILFALPGLHRVNRGAEVAFTAVGSELARLGHQVTLVGSGPPISGRPYLYHQVPCVARERFERYPTFPFLRQETAWEELTFAPGLLRNFRPAEFDATVTCAFPFTNFALRRPVVGRARPKHIFVTQNGDWPAWSNSSEYRFFGCDGLVCTNPDYMERNRQSFRCALIPNGVDLTRFSPGPSARPRFGLDASRPVVLMVSALIASKYVNVAIDTVARIPGAVLVVAGDGPLREELAAQAEDALGDRYKQLRVSPEDMPDLYRSADVFLHLSRDESFGNVFVEALAVGTPIVAYELPRTRWIVADCGFLADTADPADLMRQIDAALSGGEGRRADSVARAQKFSWGAVALEYERFIEEIVAS